MAITKGTRKDGSTYYWCREYTGYTVDGKRDRVYISADTKRAVEVERAKVIAARDAMRNRSGKITFGRYVSEYYAPTMARLAASSRDTYNKEIELRLLPSFANMDIRDINRVKIQQMLSSCGTESVARKAFNTLRTILNYAKGDGLIPTNPCETGNYVFPKFGKKRDNGFVVGDFKRMQPYFDALCQDDEPMCEMLAALGFLCGLRPEERYGLQWKDVDLINQTISVNEAITTVSKKEGSHDVKEPKTELSRRVIPMPDACAEILRRHSRNGNVLKVGYVLQSSKGGHASPSTARHRWERFCKRHQLPFVTIENMRHSFATSYLHAGGNVADLSRILGHSDINTTYRRYVKPDIDAMRVGMDSAVSLPNRSEMVPEKMQVNQF